MAAIDGLDAATRHYLNACEDYARDPTEIQRAAVVEIANLHAEAFKIAAIALNSDTGLEEYRTLLEQLLLEQDTARTTGLNVALIIALGEEALEGLEFDRSADEAIHPTANQVLVKGAYQHDCATCHAQCLHSDTQIFLDIIAQAA